MNVYIEVLLRTILAVAVMLVLARLNGPKQISQLTFYDYIVGITAGSIAASLCIDTNIDMWLCVMAAAIFMLSSLLFSFLTNKSITMRRLLTGQAIFLIDRGRILYDGLRRARFDLSDLMRELRTQGYFDIGKINYAILETNGNVSVMPHAADRPPTAAESGTALADESVLANVIEDGKLLKGNLRAFGRDEEWLASRLAAMGCADRRDVLLATLDEKGELCVHYRAEPTNSERTVLQ